MAELIFHEWAFDHLFTEGMVEPRRAKTWLMWGCSGIDHLGSWPGQDNPPIPSQARMHLTWPQEFSSTSYFSRNPFLTFLGNCGSYLELSTQPTSRAVEARMLLSRSHVSSTPRALAWCFKELLYFCAVPLITSWAVQDRSLLPTHPVLARKHLCRPQKHNQKFAS